MNTNDLITMLAKQAGPVENPVSPLFCTVTLGAALMASLALAHLWLGFVPLSLFGQMGPWLKILFGAALVATCKSSFVRAGQPGTTHSSGIYPPVLVFSTVALLALGDFAASENSDRAALVWGHSWSVCPRNILTLSIPILASFLYIMQQMAPVNSTKAGAYSGLMAGALSAMVYALSCTETAFPFIALWYGAGILLTCALGALLGFLFLRW